METRSVLNLVQLYCILGCKEINALRARGGRARVSVNFCKFSPCVACAARPRGFDSLPSLSDIGTVSEARFILRFQAEVSKRFYSSKANGSNVCDFSAAKNSVQFCDIEKISASHTQNLSSRIYIYIYTKFSIYTSMRVYDGSDNFIISKIAKKWPLNGL